MDLVLLQETFGGLLLTVELYGRARLLAGVRTATLDATTLGEVLLSLARTHAGLVGPVLTREGLLTSAYVASINGLRFTTSPSDVLKDGDAIIIMSSISGG